MCSQISLENLLKWLFPHSFLIQYIPIDPMWYIKPRAGSVMRIIY